MALNITINADQIALMTRPVSSETLSFLQSLADGLASGHQQKGGKAARFGSDERRQRQAKRQAGEVKQAQALPSHYLKGGISRAVATKDVNLLRTLLDRITVSEGNDFHLQAPDMTSSELAKELEAAVLIAVAGRSPEMVDLLLTRGARVTPDGRSYPIVLNAIDMNARDTIDVFVRHGVDFSVTSSLGSALHSASRSNYVEILDKVLALNTLDVNFVDQIQGATALHVATQHGHAQCLCRLLQHGADINCQDKTFQRTPLHYAAQRGDVDTAKLLLESGADQTRVDKDGFNPWMLAANYNKVSVLGLLSEGMDPNCSVSEGKTLAHVSCEIGNARCLEQVIRLGADLSLRDDHGNTPLMYAVQCGSRACINLLGDDLKCRASVNATNDEGLSALHLAIDKTSDSLQGSNKDMVRMLTSLGADVDQRLPDGRTPLMRCINDLRTVKTLLRHGADQDLVTDSGENLLWWFARTCPHNLDVLRYLLEVNVHLGQTGAGPRDPRDNCHLTPLLNLLDDHSEDFPLQTIRLLVDAGFSLANLRQWVDRHRAGAECEAHPCLPGVASLLRLKTSTPPSLAEQSRRAVLQELGHNEVQQKIAQLQLPQIIQHYLDYRNFMAWNRMDNDEIMMNCS